MKTAPVKQIKAAAKKSAPAKKTAENTPSPQPPSEKLTPEQLAETTRQEIEYIKTRAIEFGLTVLEPEQTTEAKAVSYLLTLGYTVTGSAEAKAAEGITTIKPVFMNAEYFYRDLPIELQSELAVAVFADLGGLFNESDLTKIGIRSEDHTHFKSCLSYCLNHLYEINKASGKKGGAK